MPERKKKKPKGMKYSGRPKSPLLLSHLSRLRSLLLLLTALPAIPKPAGLMSFLSSRFEGFLELAQPGC